MGEILGVGSMLAAGVVLLDVGPGRLMVIGAGIDNMPAGISLGAALGSPVGFVMGRKEP